MSKILMTIVGTLIFLTIFSGCGNQKEETASKPVEQQSTKVEFTDQQKQVVTKWYKEIKSDMDLVDQKWQEWDTIMDAISNKSIDNATAANRLDSLYNEMDTMSKKVDKHNAPDGLTDDSKKKLHQSILNLTESINAKRGACMTLRDALKNNSLKDSKIEIVQKKVKGSQDQFIKGMSNITNVTDQMGIDITKL